MFNKWSSVKELWRGRLRDLCSRRTCEHNVGKSNDFVAKNVATASIKLVEHFQRMLLLVRSSHKRDWLKDTVTNFNLKK